MNTAPSVMNPLGHALQRLYCLPRQTCRILAETGQPRVEGFRQEHLHLAVEGSAVVHLPLLDDRGRARALVLTLARNRDWPLLAALYQGLDRDLGLPPPALAVLAGGGYQLWFSLAEAVPAAQGLALLRALSRRYLTDTVPQDLLLSPDPDGRDSVALVPSRHGASPRWSAFVDPNLGGMFAEEEPGLELPPSPEGQAALLARFDSIEADDLHRALKLLGVDTDAATAHPDRPASGPVRPPATTDASPVYLPVELSGPYTDPRHFLLAVMNSPQVAAALRIQAAAALLAHPENAPQP